MTEKKKDPESATPAVAGRAEIRFSKEQLLASNRFQDRRDLVEALLKDGELYTIKAVKEKIENYMKGKVR